MSDYRRLISYIYSYENGIKTKNAGYARVESKDGVCKISISLRIVQDLQNEAEDSSLEVFMFTRKKGQVFKTRIGRMKTDHENSAFRATFDSNNIGDARFRLLDIAGIFISSKSFLQGIGSNNTVYASEWDDTTVLVEEFIDRGKEQEEQAEKDSDNVGHDSSQVTDKEGEDTNQTDANQTDTNQTDTNRTDANQTDVNQTDANQTDTNQTDANQTDVNQTDTDQTNANQTDVNQSGEDQTRANAEETNIADIAQTDLNQDEKEVNDYQEQLQKLMMNPAQSKQIEVPENNISKNNLPDHNKTNIKPDLPDHNKLDKNMPDHNKPDKNKPVNNHLDRSDYFAKLWNCYPNLKIEGLSDRCIKITPHDISYLPRRYWHLGNNSFLLHAFYSYRYILLCEKMPNGNAEGNKENESRYMICVPGINGKREQTIARTYGFFDFKEIPQENVKDFGYWCFYL